MCQSVCRLSTTQFSAIPLPRGGILADEMGLGKTVEILSLILAHRRSHSHSIKQPTGMESGPQQRSEEGSAAVVMGDRVECVCGAVEEGKGGGGEFVQCERCLVWQHSACVKYSPEIQETFVCIKCLLEQVGTCSSAWCLDDLESFNCSTSFHSLVCFFPHQIPAPAITIV